MFSFWRKWSFILLVCFIIAIHGGESRRMRNYRSSNSASLWNNGNTNAQPQNSYGVSQPIYNGNNNNVQDSYNNQQGNYGQQTQNQNQNQAQQQGGFSGNAEQDEYNGGGGNGGGGGHQRRPRFNHNEMEETGMVMKKAFGLTKIVLSPIVLPMIFFVGIVLLLFFAVVGSSAVVGGALNGRNKHYRPYRPEVFARQLSYGTVKLAENVLSSDECIERISCELLSKTKGYPAQKWVTSALESIPKSKDNLIIGRISRSLKNTRDCGVYSCSSASYLSRLFKLF